MTFTPTYETLVLMDKITKGDTLAIKDLWQHVLPDAPFDPTRPIKDLSDDIAKVLSEYNEEEAKKEEAKKVSTEKTALTNNVDRLLSDAEEIVALILNRQPKGK